MAALQDELRRLSETVRSLESQMATLAGRNRELEASHLQLAAYRAETERDVAERAAEILREAEAHAHEVTAIAHERAHRLEEEARTRSLELIAAVGEEIDALEREAAKLDRNVGATGPTAEGESAEGGESQGEAAEAAEIRGQIGDLLRLRESIVHGIRGAVEGFNRELEQLEKPPLAAAPDPDAPSAEESASGQPAAPEAAAAVPAARDGLAIEVHVEPVTGVLEASRIEQGLAGIAPAADAHLRAVENGTAALSVWGLDAEGLRDGITAQFPGATVEWTAEDRVTLRLAPAEAA